MVIVIVVVIPCIIIKGVLHSMGTSSHFNGQFRTYCGVENTRSIAHKNKIRFSLHFFLSENCLLFREM